MNIQLDDKLRKENPEFGIQNNNNKSAILNVQAGNEIIRGKSNTEFYL
jgi:hypothetical protein